MPRRSLLHAAIVFFVPVVVYAGAGVVGAYLANDDFSWLNDARTLGVRHAFQISGRSHFYRPVIEIWFAGIVSLFGDCPSCYHVLNLITHGINGVLLYAVSARAFGRSDFALIAASLFVVMPSYVQAVAWTSAVTELLSAALLLTALLLALRAAERDRIGFHFWGSLAACAAAMYAHESCAALFGIIPLVVLASRRRPHRRVVLTAIAAAVALGSVFLATTIAANQRSYVFTEGHYAIGRHMWPHARDYLLSLYVGRHGWSDYILFAVAAAAIIARGTAPMRAGLGWLIITMLPFLGFTWGNVGRYTYLPAMGFCWILAGVIVAIRERVNAYFGHHAAVATAALLTLVLAVRFASFTGKAIRAEVRWMEAYRTYRDEVTPLFLPQPSPVIVPAPRDSRVERDYIEPMLRWHTANPALRVQVRP